ncbi:MAG: ABC transporter permease [Alphaproteobacteria bacterium]
MARFLALRLLAAIPVMGVVAIVVFALLRLSGRPGALLAGDAATPEQIAKINADLGLDRPLVEQFLLWIGNLLSGDLGYSFHSRISVAKLIADRIEPTLSLAATTLLFSIAIAVPMGVIAAWRHGRAADTGVMIFAVIGFSVPVFVLGYFWVFVFSMNLDWLPVQGFVPIGKGLGEFLRHLALPTLALSAIYIALVARITRTSMLESLSQDYIRTAYAKGASTFAVLTRHALRNAAVPIVSVIGIGLVLLVGGVVVTETVFNIPGIGGLIVDAILGRDYPIIQGVLLLLALVYVMINLLIDFLYTLLDPRIRY